MSQIRIVDLVRYFPRCSVHVMNKHDEYDLSETCWIHSPHMNE